MSGSASFCKRVLRWGHPLCGPGLSGVCAGARRYVDSGFEGVGSAKAQVSQRADGFVHDETAVGENLLEFGGGGRR